jgi:RNA polymerase sigma-70 factor, ECF subfamily
VSFAAISHTQRISSAPFLRNVSTLRTFAVGGQRGSSSVRVEKPETEIELVCRGGMAAMDMTDEADPTVKDRLERSKARANEFVPDEHTERILHLFPRAASEDREKDIAHREFSPDPYEQILALYKEYRPRLLGYMRSLYLKWDEAEEVIQETFMELTNAVMAGRAIESMQGWVVNTAHHLAVDVIKKRVKNEDRFRDTTEFEFDTVPDPAIGPEESYLRNEQRREIMMALSRFSPQQRQCFHMRAQGLRYKDIGLALGISEQRAALVVKQVIFRLAANLG